MADRNAEEKKKNEGTVSGTSGMENKNNGTGYAAGGAGYSGGADKMDSDKGVNDGHPEAGETEPEDVPGNNKTENNKKTDGRKKKKKGNTAITVAIIICICVMAYSGFRLISAMAEYKRGTDEYDGLREYTETVDDSAESSGDTAAEAVSADSTGTSEDSLFTDARPPIDVDWASLKKINSDIVGWIYVGSVDISYPVVHGTDDDFYLHRTFEKKDNFAGSIFVEYMNSRDFTDPNTIVYGHNMRNGSMFGMLAHIQSDELYRDDPWIWILTPDGNYRYRMFSMYRPEVGSDTYTLFSGTNEVFTKWCGEMYDNSAVDLEKPDFTEDSRIITLSTCTTDSGHRFVVQGIAEK